MNRDTQISIRYLIITAAALLSGAVAAFVIKTLGVGFPPCAFHKVTGLYCLTCGSTRAALAMTEFNIVRSVLFNPFPVMLTIYLLTVIFFEIICIIRKKRVAVKWLPWTVIIMLSVLIPFFLLRNFGIIPMPV